MDDTVLAAMARWPNVPDVFGWLSLSSTGQWRLHPGGAALPEGIQANPSASGPDPDPAAMSALSEGEVIGSPAITAFIGRNYGHDTEGRWFFQNGPQRVFVRLDAAPYILRTTGTGTALRTHSGLGISHVLSWVLDDSGRLFAMTDRGPGIVAGRDLPALVNALRTTHGETLAEALALGVFAGGNQPVAGPVEPIHIQPIDALANSPTETAGAGAAKAQSPVHTAPLRFSTTDGIAATLGFTRFPRERLGPARTPLNRPQEPRP
ncbi:MAG TPA: DUF2946 family protein [Burkholderiaceae bacterium]|nr:DUF2946 family protein [Burkholderiaceae bacterium]